MISQTTSSTPTPTPISTEPAGSSPLGTVVSPAADAGEARQARIPIRVRETLHAVPVLDERRVTLVDGSIAYARVGDWIICRGQSPIGCLPDPVFRDRYEPVQEGILVIDGPNRAVLESQLGFGMTRDADTLTAAVRRLAYLKVGTVEISFSVTQWQEIARRAEKRRQSIAQWMQQTVDRLLQDLWTSG